MERERRKKESRLFELIKAAAEKKIQFIIEKPHLMNRLKLMSINRPATTVSGCSPASMSKREETNTSSLETHRRRVQSAPGGSRQASQQNGYKQNRTSSPLSSSNTTTTTSYSTGYYQQRIHEEDAQVDEEFQKVMEESRLEAEKQKQAEES